MNQCHTVWHHAIRSLALGLLLSSAAFAGSATWLTFPASGDWNASGNWTPATVPNGAADTATFNSSNTTAVSLSSNTEVNGIVFSFSASFTPYTITTPPFGLFTVSGIGITNNSGVTQNFVTSVSGAFVGQTEFKNSASAGTLTSFTNYGSMFSSVYFGAGTHFFNTSTADHARLNNNGGGVNGALGGITGFYDGATAASAIINNNGGAVSGARGGLTSFVGNSSAENAQITNRRGAVNGAGGGYTLFYDNATAYGAVFTNLDSGSSGGNGGVSFLGNSSAGGGVFANNGGTFNGALGGYTGFSENSTARVGTYYNYGGTVIGGGGGHTYFGNTATAYYGTFANYGGTTAAGSGGATVFAANSTAGNGEFSNYAATGAGGEGGWTEFYYNSSAGNGTFTNYPAPFNITGPGTTTFNDTATAGDGTFVNNGGSSGASGRTLFAGNSIAGNGNFTNNAAASSTQTGGHTDFSSGATAGTATFDNKAGAASGVAGGFMSFSNTATAGNATIYNRGAAVASGGGGSTYFAGSSTAGGSTLYAEAGSASGSGGSIVFQETSDGGTARAVLSGAGISAGGLDLTELNSASMGIGSIEGAGVVSLGSKTLTVGGNNLDTTYSGIIRNSGNLTKVGTGALTLGGANTYTGVTTVNSGTLIVNGSIAGNADVKSGATLKGTGSIAGTLTCEAGAICAPGTSPGTLTVGGLDLMSGSTLEYELGATRDHIVVTSQGGVSLGGVLNLSLLDGYIPTEPIFLFEGSIETITGTFSAVNAPIFNGHTLSVVYSGNQVSLQVVLAGDFNSDGNVDGADYVVWRKGVGTIYTQDDYNDWRANFGATAGMGSGSAGNLSSQSAVPEPASAMLLLLGLVIVRFRCHGRSYGLQHQRLAFMKEYPVKLLGVIVDAPASLFIPTRHPNLFRYGALLLCAVAGLLLTAAASRAVEVTWTGSINSNWSNSGNWDVHVPLSGDSVFFPNTGQTNVRADFSSYPDTDPQSFDQPALHLQSLTFDASAPAYSVEVYTAGESSPMYQARLDLDGAGVVNQLGVTQNFVIDRGGGHGVAGGGDVGVDGSRLSLNNSASAGNNVSYHVLGGVTTFHTNPAGEYIFLRPSGGSVVFNNSASAGSSTFVIDGGAGNGGIPAFVEFHNDSTAANGIFTNIDGAAGGNPPGQPSPIFGFGGQTNFYDTASAGAATLSNIGQSLPYSGVTEGITNFRDNSSAGSASIHNGGSTADVTFGGGGATQFFGHSTAASANFINDASTISYNHGGGYTYFGDDSTAANALIDNLGGNATYGPGTTVFYDRSTAANAVISNRGLSGGGMGGVPASTTFHADSSAGSATIHNFHGADIGGLTQFYERTTAANAHIILELGRSGGTIAFNDDSTAGSAFLDASANGTTGLITFKGNATAANSIINLGANSGFELRIFFRDFASAGNATITAGEMSAVRFFNNSTAANANIAVRADSSLSFAGSFDAGPTTSAGNATIHLDGATSVLNSGAIASFANYSTAADSSITVDGTAVADGSAASLAFSSYADAGNATIFLKSSPLVGNPGGGLFFGAGASGPSARVTTEVGSVVYVAGNAGISDTSIGYITGAGNINLGASTLIVGALGQNATLSGQISGNGGSFVKTGTDSLTLAGTNTYTGLTIVEQGTLIVNGSIASHAVVKSGATLKGTGSMGIPTVKPGGIFAPGTSPGTITVAGLNLQSGSTLQFELGATRDHIVVTNNGNITLGGLLDLSILSGFNPALGQTFSLFEGSIGSITGAFSAVNAPIINGHALSLVYGTNSAMLELGNAGDFNGDGRIDSGDYVVWRKGLGTTYTQNDYNAWRAHFGQPAGSGSGAIANAAVPEPVTFLLLTFGVAGWCLRRRRAG